MKLFYIFIVTIFFATFFVNFSSESLIEKETKLSLKGSSPFDILKYVVHSKFAQKLEKMLLVLLPGRGKAIVRVISFIKHFIGAGPDEDTQKLVTLIENESFMFEENLKRITDMVCLKVSLF